MANVGFGTLTIIPSARGFAAALEKEVSGSLSSVGAAAGKKLGESINKSLAVSGKQGAQSISQSLSTSKAGETIGTNVETSLAKAGREGARAIETSLEGTKTRISNALSASLTSSGVKNATAQSISGSVEKGLKSAQVQKSLSSSLKGLGLDAATQRAVASSVSRSISSGAQEGGANIRNAVNKAADDSSSHMARIFRGTFRTLVTYAGGYLAISAAVRTVSAAFDFVTGSVVGFNSQVQQANIAFTTFLGSGIKAKVFLDELKDFAKTTPFQFPDLVASAQQLISMGIAAKDVIPTLTAVGDAAAGLGASSETIRRVTLAIGQIAAKGRVQSDELLQLQEAGIPALQILADQFGVTTLQMQKMISANKVLSTQALPLLVSGIENGTKHVQAFGGIMSKQSKTFAGAVSNIKDSAQQFLATSFKPIFDEMSLLAQGFARNLSSDSFAAFGARLEASVAKGVTALRGLFNFVKTGTFSADLFKGLGIEGDSDLFKGMQRVRTVLIDALTDIRDFITNSFLPAVGTLKTALGGIVAGAALTAFRSLAAVLAHVVGPGLVIVANAIKTLADLFGKLPGPMQAVALALVGLTFAVRIFNNSLIGSSGNATGLGRFVLGLRSVGLTLQGLPGQMRTATAGVGGFRAKMAAATGAIGSAAGSGLAGGLKGLFSLLGGGWGIGIGLATAAIVGFAQAQANAKADVDNLTAAIDIQSGKLSDAGILQIADRLHDSISDSDWKRLAKVGITFDQVFAAIRTGGPALDDIQGKLKKLQVNTVTAKGASDGLTGAAKALDTTIGRERGTFESASDAAKRHKAVLDSIHGAATGAAAGLHLVMTKADFLNSALRNMPKNITLAVATKGFTDAYNAIAALELKLEELMNMANGRGTAGKGTAGHPTEHGGSGALSDVLRAHQAALDADVRTLASGKIPAAYKHFFDAVGLKPGGSSDKGGGSGTGGKSAAASAAKAAHGVALSFLQSLVDSLTKGAPAVIKATRALLAQVKAVARKQSAGSAIVAFVANDNAKLVALAKGRDRIVAALVAANTKLEGLKSQAQDLASATASGISSLFNAANLVQVGDMLHALDANVKAAQAFRTNLLLLAKRGLNQTTITQLAQAGVEQAGQAAKNLAGATSAQIAEINKQQKTLSSVASETGTTLANDLFGAGVRAAQGLVAGLKSQQSAIEKVMLAIAKSMTAAIRSALGIKSPSAVFHDIGSQVGAGLVNGLVASQPAVTQAVTALVPVGGVHGGGSATAASGGSGATYNITSFEPDVIVRSIGAFERRQDILFAGRR